MLGLVTIAQEAPTRSQAVRAAQIQVIYSQIPTATIGGVFLAVVLVGVLWGAVSHIRLMVWLGSYLVLQAFRYLLFIAYRKASPSAVSVVHWSRRLQTLTVLLALSWGLLAVFLFPTQSIMHQYMVSFCIVGLSCAMIVVYAASVSFYLPCILATLLPLAGRHLYEGSSIHVGVSLAILTLVVVLIFSARKTHSLISKFILVKSEKENLTSA